MRKRRQSPAPPRLPVGLAELHPAEGPRVRASSENVCRRSLLGLPKDRSNPEGLPGPAPHGGRSVRAWRAPSPTDSLPDLPGPGATSQPEGSGGSTAGRGGPGEGARGRCTRREGRTHRAAGLSGAETAAVNA